MLKGSLDIRLCCMLYWSYNKGGYVSNPTQEIDEKLWERYLQDLRVLSAANEGITLFPSLSDYSVWLQDQDLDTSNDY